MLFIKLGSVDCAMIPESTMSIRLLYWVIEVILNEELDITASGLITPETVI